MDRYRAARRRSSVGAVPALTVPRLSTSRAVDVLLGLLVAAQLAELWLGRPEERALSLAVLVVISTGVLFLRRRVPLAAVLLCLGGHAALIQLQPNGLATTFLALLLAVGLFGGMAPVPAVFGLVGSWLVAAEGAWLDSRGGGLADFALSAAIFTGVWAAGFLLARSSRAAHSAAERAAAAEDAHRRAAEDAVREERARMTRELHDVVAHGLTVLVVQSVAAQEDLEHGADLAQVARRLRASEDVARESLHELRTLLGILGAGTEGAGAASGVTGVEALVGRLRSAGLDVALEVEGDPGGIGPGLELATYRIVQEGLTNAAKHGAGPAVVRLRVADAQVEIVVENPCALQSALPGAGRGLPGLRERVALHHGTLEAGAEDGHYRLRAVLPEPRDRQLSGSES